MRFFAGLLEDFEFPAIGFEVDWPDEEVVGSSGLAQDGSAPFPDVDFPLREGRRARPDIPDLPDVHMIGMNRVQQGESSRSHTNVTHHNDGRYHHTCTTRCQ